MAKSSYGVPPTKQIMKELAEERRATKKKELEEKHRKILRMVELGCDYDDIGKRYGMTRQSVKSLIYKRFPGCGVNSKFGSHTSHELARYVDGIS